MQSPFRLFGAERVMVDLVSGLQKSGRIAPLVFLMQEQRRGVETDEYQQAFEAQGVNVTTMPVHGALSRALLRAIRKQTADLDVLHSVGNKADVYACLSLQGSGVRWVSTVHGWLFRSDVKERLYEWLDQKVLRSCDRVVVLSRFYEKMLTEKGFANLVRIPSGIPDALIEEVGRNSIPPPKDKPAIGMIGRFSSEKRHAHLIDAAVRLRQKGLLFRILLAGTGPEEIRLREKIDREGLTDSIVFCGYMAPKEFFQKIDLLVMCSTVENLPFSILEAMAYGVPVAAYDVGGIPDLVEDGQTGVLIPSGSIEGLANKLEELVQNPEQICCMGKNAYERGRESFSSVQMIEKHIDLYMEVTG